MFNLNFLMLGSFGDKKIIWDMPWPPSYTTTFKKRVYNTVEVLNYLFTQNCFIRIKKSIFAIPLNPISLSSKESFPML